MAKKKSKQAALLLPSMVLLEVGNIRCRRWDESVLEIADYYYDEPISIIKLSKRSDPDEFPPNEIDQSFDTVELSNKSSSRLSRPNTQELVDICLG